MKYVSIALILALAVVAACFTTTTVEATAQQELWHRYEQHIRSIMENNFCARDSACRTKLNNKMWQMTIDPMEARWDKESESLSGEFARFVPKWSNTFEHVGYGADASVENRYKELIMAYSDKTTAAKAFAKLQTCPRDKSGHLPWEEVGKTTLSSFVRSISSSSKKSTLFDMNNAVPSGDRDASFIRNWYAHSGTVITRNMAYFDKYDLRFEAKGIAPIEVSPAESWLDRQFLRKVQGELGSKFYSSKGRFSLLPAIAWVAYQPRVTATVTRTMYYKLKEETEANSLGVSVGGFFFSTGKGGTRSLDDDEDDFDFDTLSDSSQKSEIRFLGEVLDDDDILSENTYPSQQVTFSSRSVATNEGVGALAWFLADVDGDKKDDVIQLWNCGNLCIIYYTAASGFKAHHVRTNQGPGAMRFFVGDVDGDGRADIVQIWNNRGRIALIYYTAKTNFKAHGADPKQGSGHVAFMSGDVDGDGRMDIVHLWNNRGRLQIMYYTAASGFNRAVSVGTNQGVGAIAWFMGDIDGDRRDDVIQLWNNRGRLSFIFYTAASGFNARGVGTTQGTGAVRYFLADVDGDKKKDIVQVWNNRGRANILYYTAASNFQARNIATSQGTGAVVWAQGDFYGDGKEQIIQGWNCGSLCLMFYTPSLNFDAHSYKTNQGVGAVAWLTGDVDGDGSTDVVQLWNNRGRLQIMWHSAQVNRKTYKIEFESNSPHPQIVAVSSAILPNV